MKLEQQLTNLELSKKLKELGVKQESLFDWWVNHSFPEVKKPEKYNKKHWKSIQYMIKPSWLKNKNWGHNDKLCSSFSVAELGEMLPSRLNKQTDRFTIELQVLKFPQKWVCGYWIVEENKWQFAKEDDTEANARAKMLIYLLENKLLDVSKI